jgi:hypothetical protein
VSGRFTDTLFARETDLELRSVRSDFLKERHQEYESNAQKCLDIFMMRDEDILGVQGLLALIILHQGNANSKQAFMLTSAAIRLAHRLQLHTRSSHANNSPEEARQRDNVFWICYLLDKVVRQSSANHEAVC